VEIITGFAGTEIPFNAPVLCTKFQLDPSMRLRFIVSFLSVRKDEKMKNLNETLGARISKTAGAICVKFGMYTCLPGGHLCSKFGLIQAGDLGTT